MGKTLQEVLDALPARERRAVEARARDLRAEEMTLRELRKAMGKTQVQLARRLGKPQTAVSRIETQADMLLSTLAAVVEGLGGRLRIHAELPGHAPVELVGLGDIRPSQRVLEPRRTRTTRMPLAAKASVAPTSPVLPRHPRPRKPVEPSNEGMSHPPQRKGHAAGTAR